MELAMIRIGEQLKQRLRMFIWKYRKKLKNKYKALGKIGISKYSTCIFVLYMTISNRRLK